VLRFHGDVIFKVLLGVHLYFFFQKGDKVSTSPFIIGIKDSLA